MNRKIIIFIILITIVSGLFIVSCQRYKTEDQGIKSEKHHHEEEGTGYWTCGMHPSVKVTPEQYEKGQTKCPICNMDLVPVSKDESSGKEGEVLLKLSDRAVKLAGVKTSLVSYLSLTKEIRTVGIIDYDERKKALVTARFAGRIEKLFVNFTGREVQRGTPLVRIYSPDLISTQEEYLLALETLEKVKESHIPEVVANATSLVESTRKRLLLWGITEYQIDKLREKGEAEIHTTIYAPIAGTVISKTAIEGKYIKEGENLYSIADLSRIWVLSDIFEEDISWVKLGTRVEITTVSYPGEIFSGTISFIDPFLNEKTRSEKIRVEIPNTERKLKPGMYVDALIQVPVSDKNEEYYTCPMHPNVREKNPGECPECGMFLKKVDGSLVLSVPKSAVLDVGMRKLVYVDRGEGVFESREVILGPEAEATIDNKKEKYYLILEGLAEGEKVVTRANFLLDSQTQLTGEAAGVYGGALGVDD